MELMGNKNAPMKVILVQIPLVGQPRLEKIEIPLVGQPRLEKLPTQPCLE
jgi:hypothetical protein